MLKSFHTYFLFIVLSLGYAQASIHFSRGEVLFSRITGTIASEHFKIPVTGTMDVESIDMEEEDKRSFLKDYAKTSNHIGFALLIVPGYSLAQTRNCLSIYRYFLNTSFFESPVFSVLRL